MRNFSNDVSKKEVGFSSDYNEVTIFYNNNKSEKLKKMHKANIANEIVERLISKLNYGKITELKFQFSNLKGKDISVSLPTFIMIINK